MGTPTGRGWPPVCGRVNSAGSPAPGPKPTPTEPRELCSAFGFLISAPHWGGNKKANQQRTGIWTRLFRLV